jgi:nicotinic acid phosphoribosyltransferase
MTSWKTEREAILNMIRKFGGGVYATVMDSYDYDRALYKVVPSLKEEKNAQKGLWVLRPDSGDPVEAIMKALDAGEKAFGATVNKKGFKVLNGIAVIQGDGIGKDVVKKILDSALAAGYSAQNIAYGMGGGLLQKVNEFSGNFLIEKGES